MLDPDKQTTQQQHPKPQQLREKVKRKRENMGRTDRALAVMIALITKCVEGPTAWV